MIPALFWESTKQCNFHCEYCYSGSDPSSPTMPPEILIDFLSEFKKQGGRLLLVSGGEPSLCPDLPMVLSACRELGLATSLSTNGSRHDRTWVEQIAPDVTEFLISVDGPESYTNKKRGHPKAFSFVQAFLETCRSVRVNATLQFNVSDESWQYLPWFKKYAEEHRIEHIRLAHIASWGKAKAGGIGLSIDRQMSLIEEASAWALETRFQTIPRTNLLKATDFRLFYSSLNGAVAPWVLSNGWIVPFYSPSHDRWVHGHVTDPSFSFMDIFQNPRVQHVLERAYSAAIALPVLSIEDVVYKAAGEVGDLGTLEVSRPTACTEQNCREGILECD